MKKYKYSKERRKKISEGTKKAMANPIIRKKISQAKKGKPSHRKGTKHTTQAKKRMSNSSKGQIPWNKGLTNLPSPSKKTIEKRKIKMLGANNHFWKGNNVGYGGVHTWIRKKYGKAKYCKNNKCLNKSIIYEWANISGKYKRNKKDYFQLCRSCHRRFDMGSLKMEVIKG